MVANRKLGSGCTCVAVVIGGGGDGIASTPIAVLVAAADPGPASTGTSATIRNRMPRLRQSKLPARACGAALAQASATSIRVSDTAAGNARPAATTLRQGHAAAWTRFMAGAPPQAGAARGDRGRPPHAGPYPRAAEGRGGEGGVNT